MQTTLYSTFKNHSKPFEYMKKDIPFTEMVVNPQFVIIQSQSRKSKFYLSMYSFIYIKHTPITVKMHWMIAQN